MNNEKEGYSLDELVKIGDQIHNCTTAFMLIDIEEKGEHNVLMTAKGKREDIIGMVIESMLKDSRIADIIEHAFINYALKMEQQQKNN